MAFDFIQIYVTLYRIYGGALYERFFLLRQKLYALCGTVRSLVVLPLEKSYGKNFISVADGKIAYIGVVDGRLGKHVDDRGFELVFGYTLHVVAEQYAQSIDFFTEHIRYLGNERL